MGGGGRCVLSLLLGGGVVCAWAPCDCIGPKARFPPRKHWGGVGWGGVVCQSPNTSPKCRFAAAAMTSTSSHQKSRSRSPRRFPNPSTSSSSSSALPLDPTVHDRETDAESEPEPEPKPCLPRWLREAKDMAEEDWSGQLLRHRQWLSEEEWRVAQYERYSVSLMT